MQKRSLFSLSLLAFIIHIPLSSAADLITTYQQALQSDPSLQEALATQLAAQEILPQRRANVLPSLVISANTANVRNNITPENNTAAAVFNTNTHGYTLLLSQPIFNYQSWVQLQQATQIVKQANANYQTAMQDLMLRVTKAYFNVLLAKDNLNFIKAKAQTTQHHLEQIKARYQVGLDTLTSLSEAQAAYDATLAQQISADNDLVNSKEQLQTLTGVYPQDFAEIRQPLALVTPLPIDVEAWVKMALTHNWQLQALSYAQNSARDAIKIIQAGNLPTLSAVGSYQNYRGTYLLNPQSNLQTTSVGFQLSLPIYNGGLITSQTRQAHYDYQKANSAFEIAYRNVKATTRQTFNSILAGISKLKADQQAIKSNQSALTTTQAAFNAGTRTIVDVLNIQQGLYAVQLQYAQDEYAYIIDTLTLKFLTGALCTNDLIQINTWLQTVKIDNG